MPIFKDLPEGEKTAFTSKYNQIVRALPIRVIICEYSSEKESSQLPIVETTAIIDTGATCSVITRRIAKKLKLVPIGKSKMQGALRIRKVNLFLVTIVLPQKLAITGVPVLEIRKQLAGGFDALIGMDILSMGDFAISNSDGKTLITYQLPSTHKINFVDEINIEKQKKAKPK